jgi:hypothetical protein
MSALGHVWTAPWQELSNNRRHLCWSAIHYSGQPSALGAALSRVANDGHGTSDKEPSQIAIALLGDTAEPFLAAG